MPHRLAVGSLAVVTLVMWLGGGCINRSERIPSPVVDAAAAGEEALGKYDANKDGAISGEELDKAPALKAASRRIDANTDGKITASEVTARIRQWQATKLGLTMVQCVVRMDGKPLADARVTLVPEEFLGPNVQQATGTTDANGNASLSIAHPPRPRLAGVAPGFYRVEISKQANGSETVPAQYNTATTLGLEIAVDTDTLSDGTIGFELKTK